MAQDSETQGGVCRNCCLDMTAEATVRLWDGKDYCETCVEVACPGLAEYARTHEALEEEMPHSAWRIAVIIAVIGICSIAGLAAILWAVAVGLGAPAMDPEGPRMALLFAAIGLPIVIMFCISHATSFAHFRVVMSVRDDQVMVTMRSVTKTTPLSECEWYVGKTWHMTHPIAATPYSGLLRDTAVVLILPQLTRPSKVRLDPQWDDPWTVRLNWPRRVATGFTEEARHRWESFLTLASVRRRAFDLPTGSSV